MSEPRGIVYFFCGVKYAERMVVSWHSLRQHYQGPVTVGVTDEYCKIVAKRAERALDFRVIDVPLMKVRRHSAYLSKTLIPQWTPYEETIFLDGDTVIAGPLEELFGYPLLVTAFSDWHSQGRRMSGRINRWRGKSPYIDALVERQLAHEHPALNTGVFSFCKGFPRLETWHEITRLGAGLHMTDELAMQLLHSEIEECRVVDDRFNCSPIYGTHRQQAVVWHFHGGKHLRRDRGKEIWGPAFERAVAERCCQIDQWAGDYDGQVRAYRREKVTG